VIIVVTVETGAMHFLWMVGVVALDVNIKRRIIC
jgi:hypothetical protein